MTAKDYTYENCMKLWYEFFELHNGFKPKVDGATGKHLKMVIKYFATNHPDHSPESCFSAMFNNWHLLPVYYAKQRDIKNINSNLNTILTEIKTHHARIQRKLPSHWER
jgi:hypothetical protein